MANDFAAPTLLQQRLVKCIIERLDREPARLTRKDYEDFLCEHIDWLYNTVALEKENDPTNKEYDVIFTWINEWKNARI